ncbi:MAG: response regulator [Gemmatimonadota bacterium]|nr:response regulator [Gemmatimonadota bacterium]
MTDPTKQIPGAPPRVLIVDDERRNSELLKVLLAPEGYALLTASSGEDALALLADQQPDLILLDVMMPGMDGYQVATRIKQNPATNNIPVIMLTALDDRNARMLGLNAGAEDFLTKPVDRAELCVRVRNLLRLKAYGDKLRIAHAALAIALAEASEARLMAEHANNAKTQFLRSMSHELRTPLNAISGYTEILELGIRGTVNPAQVKDLGRIKRASSYLLRLINDVLTIARLEGARPLHLISIPVNPVLSEVEGLCILQAKANGLTLTVVPCDHEIFATADAERFQQILLNLVTNAIKFTPKDGTISVTCDDDGGSIRVRVKDTGVGVRMLDLERVFEPFVQIDRHLTSETQQGVGLGLSISRELARAMSGDLTLESVEGIGSTFTLTLPMASDISAAPPTEAAALQVQHPARRAAGLAS